MAKIDMTVKFNASLFNYFTDELQARVQVVGREAAIETAHAVRESASRNTYESWQERTGFAGQNWEVREDEIRQLRTGPAGAIRGSAEGTYSVPVGSYQMTRSEVDGQFYNYNTFLEDGFTDLHGNHHEGGHMLRRALQEHGGTLQANMVRSWDSRVAGRR